MRKKIRERETRKPPAKECIIKDQKTDYPLMVIPNLILFPDNILPLSALTGLKEEDLQKAQKGQLKFGVVSRLKSDKENREILAGYGTEAVVTALIKLPNGDLGAIIKGGKRFILRRAVRQSYGYTGEVSFVEDLAWEMSAPLQAEAKALKSFIMKVLKYQSGLNQETTAQLLTHDEPDILCNLITPHLSLTQKEKLRILGNFNFPQRLKVVIRALGKELELLQISTRIQDRVKDGVHDNLKRNFLREQMQVIRKELGDLGGGEGDDVAKLKKTLEEKGLPEKVWEAASRELDRLSSMHPGTPEYTVSLTWLNWLKDLSWNETEAKNELSPAENLKKASEILASHHAGLKKVKDRILEFIAVLSHKGRVSGQILLLAGPPGVGKTSLGQAIARALGRPYVRVSLGGVKDEAEIRGHRRTYIGSMPGKIIQALKQAGSKRPVILLDEIDKLGRDGMQDLSSALLEVLDPEQNKNFTDHYLGVPYDLSEVLFIATANNAYELSAPLLDRMELIELPGYTEQEKVIIARDYLIPRLRKELSLTPEAFSVSDQALSLIIRYYTRESGVRQINRQLEKIGRKLVRGLVEGPESEGVSCIAAAMLPDFLGTPPYPEDPAPRSLPAGVAIGMAYTSVGGDILYIESRKSSYPGSKHELKLTGSLGKVMQESAQAVYSFLLSGPVPFLNQEELMQSLVHIHLPAGATPKDGPSAGVALLCAMTSLFTNRPMASGIAMTGEITLRGDVLPVGGIREKFLAAHRYGKKTIIFPKANWKDLEDIPENVLRELTLYPVELMTEVLYITRLVDCGEGEDMPLPVSSLKKDLYQGLPVPFAPEPDAIRH